ncbi:hypothetical protein [Paractinoplanes atraurantiacus]|uniref:Uncharacterized protein n=1 Tax=Paractinoplanes atraurantiacus TaxID=1036182 RepID=A0A285GZZ2_9ACTN|nr:hypothetical protein [Actinoplanes atraurantiacus]SNY29038.1 hypothetical protein SAMN05421748_103181 [Actinoplanes atraurantiacus]
MRTTDDILADLRKRAEGGEDVRQLVIAHESLARLRAERAEAVKAKLDEKLPGLDAQIRHWLGFVDEDVDDRAAGEPGKDSTKLVAVDEQTHIVDVPGVGPVRQAPTEADPAAK